MTTVREQIFAWSDLEVPTAPGGRSLNAWWDDTIAALSKERRREASRLIIYSMWGVWKERNRCTFQNVALQSFEVSALVKEEVDQRAYAHTQDPGDGPAA